MSGGVVHFEIPFDDKDRATTFYREVFGWGVHATPGIDYTIVTTGPTGNDGPSEVGFINGGMTKRQEPVARPVITIEGADMDDALAHVEQRGGSTLSPKQRVGNMGYAAYFVDCEGNVMGMWQTAG